MSVCRLNLSFIAVFKYSSSCDALLLIVSSGEDAISYAVNVDTKVQSEVSVHLKKSKQNVIPSSARCALVCSQLSVSNALSSAFE